MVTNRGRLDSPWVRKALKMRARSQLVAQTGHNLSYVQHRISREATATRVPGYTSITDTEFRDSATQGHVARTQRSRRGCPGCRRSRDTRRARGVTYPPAKALPVAQPKAPCWAVCNGLRGSDTDPMPAVSAQGCDHDGRAVWR